MAKIEKIGNIQIVDNKEDKSFYFPMISMVCTGTWYGKYQRRVRRIPNIGTASTKDWYIEYQASVQRIPNVGMKHTRRWYNTIKG